MKHLSRAQMKTADRLAIEQFGIPALLLMENAGRIVAEESIKLLDKDSNAKVLVICGKGNNGGDGFVAARYLFNRHIHVNVLYLDKANNQPRTSETAANLGIIQKLDIPILTELPPTHRLHTSSKDIRQEIKYETELLTHLFKDYGVIIDAIFGIGLEREVTSPYKEVIDAINNSGRPVVAVDIPSGLDADTGRPLGTAVRAKLTVTMAAPKKGFQSPGAQHYTGQVVVADIGIPDKVLSSLT